MTLHLALCVDGSFCFDARPNPVESLVETTIATKDIENHAFVGWLNQNNVTKLFQSSSCVQSRQSAATDSAHREDVSERSLSRQL